MSGKDRGPIGHRIYVKRAQLEAGDSAIPGIAAVVGFERAIVRIEDSAETEEH